MNNNTKRKLKQLRKSNPDYFRTQPQKNKRAKVGASAYAITRAVGRPAPR